MQAMTFTKDDIIPIEHFGRDHWSTLAYIETVEVDCKGFQIGYDARMRANRRNTRVLSEECRVPKRTGIWAAGIPMSAEHGTRLKDGFVVEGHDDWCCVQDMAVEGFFDTDEIEPGVVLHLSEKGRAVASQLREHKAKGGSFSNFEASV